jgi:hypothetical protein
MTEPRTYLTRSTRDGLGHRPDGTHPVTPDGAPDFLNFRSLEHALDFIVETPAPGYTDLLASLRHLNTNNAIYALRSVLEEAEDRSGAAATPYWTALHILTTSLRREVEASRDSFNMADLQKFRQALAANGHPIDGDGGSAGPATDDAFAGIIANNFPEGY